MWGTSFQLWLSPGASRTRTRLFRNRLKPPAIVVALLGPQDISVANPPTLLLLVDSLVRGLPGPTNAGECSTPRAGVCAVGAEGDAPPQQGLTAGSGEGDPELAEFLRKAHPLLDLWMRWLLITQRPGATGWGGQADGVPVGAFQVRGVGGGFEPLRLHGEALSRLTQEIYGAGGEVGCVA